MSFFKPLRPPKVEPPPPPARDTAADALQRQEKEQDEEVKKRRATLQGMTSTMLTGSSGVTAELTGTRTMTNG
jgi:hypothetical protein